MSTRAAELTTLRVGGEIATLVEVLSEQELIDAITKFPDALILGDGSNLLFAGAMSTQPVIKVSTRGISHEVDACSGATWTVSAGENWDDFVLATIEAGCAGLETLSGIPGTVGAAPIQNIGAYGSELNSSVARVRVFDRKSREVRTYAAADCGFGYRTSLFKKEVDRFVILEVIFQLRVGDMSNEVTYPELATELNINIGERAPVDAVRSAVLSIRTRKGMVLSSNDTDTWSAGSFFVNPTLPPSQIPAGAPAWEQEDGRVKTSAAWLIEKSGTSKGERFGNAAVSSKHVLALTNTGSATSEEIIEAARTIQNRVFKMFGITLQPEVRIVGAEL
ncbi:MAG: UDP-N-acetylmuramate dehydrogenase [Actinomycetes bacterium]